MVWVFLRFGAMEFQINTWMGDPFTWQGTKIFQYCTCPAGWVTYNFHLSCKHMHLSFKSLCNKEHKGVIYNMTSSSYSFQSTRLSGWVLGKNHLSFLDFTCNYERTSGIFLPCLVETSNLLGYSMITASQWTIFTSLRIHTLECCC